MMDSINERRLDHSVEEGRDVLASVTGVTSLDEVGELSVGPSTCSTSEVARQSQHGRPPCNTVGIMRTNRWGWRA